MATETEYETLNSLRPDYRDALIKCAESEGVDLDALDAFMSMSGAYYAPKTTPEEALEQFRDAYLGEYESLEDYAAEYISETGMLDGVPETLRCYFDYAAFARDMELGGDVTTEGRYVFSCNY